MDLGNGKVSMKQSLILNRKYHSVCFTSNCIFVIGGSVRICERYPIQRNKWALLPTGIDEFSLNVSVVVVRTSYIFAFGGRNSKD